MELKDYIKPLRKWWWLILAATLVATVTSFVVARQQPDFYRSRVTLMIGQAIDNPNPSGSDVWLTQQLAQTYAEIAYREPIRASTMTELGLEWLPEYSVNTLPDTQLLEISVTDTSPERAKAVAEVLASQLILQSPTSPEQDDQSRQDFINLQLDGLEVKITETENEIINAQEELGGVVSARQISDLQGQISALQAKLTSLQTNYANLLVNTQQGAINTLSIIEPAALPVKPVGPKTRTTVVVAAAIGLTLSVGAAFLLEYLDDSIVSPDDVLRATGVPTLAGIAKIDKDEEGDRLITLSQPRSPTSEAYRILRTGIQFSAVDNPEQARLMVTSANPSEGKSLTVANLSIVMAQTGRSVLVIDADLRRPVQHKVFRLTQKGGLTSLLLEISLSSTEEELLQHAKRVVQPTTIEGLHILTSGPIPPNPSELLGSAKMRLTLQALSHLYDYVIIDSPPVLAVTDATVISRQTDGVILVVESGSTRKGQIKQAVELLVSGNAHVIGVVINRLSPQNDGYYSYYYYRNSYYLEEPELPGDGTPSSNGRSSSPWRRKRAKKVSGTT